MRISDWSSDVCSSDLPPPIGNLPTTMPLLTASDSVSAVKGEAWSSNMKYKYALVEEIRLQAEPGLTGKCQGCGSIMTAKCGERRVWHWAHRGKHHCDHWRSEEHTSELQSLMRISY